MAVAFWHKGVGPLIADVTGAAPIVTVVVTGVPVPQPLVSVTDIVPPVEPKATLMELVFCPEVMVAPAGTDQV